LEFPNGHSLGKRTVVYVKVADFQLKRIRNVRPELAREGITILVPYTVASLIVAIRAILEEAIN
jgi:hypothetical protein